MNFELIGTIFSALAFTGGVLVVAVDTLRCLRRHARRAAHNRYVTFDVDRYILGSDTVLVERDLAAVADEILSDLPRFRYHTLIGGLSGRLVFSVYGPSGDEFVVKTVVNERRLSRAQMSLFNEAMVLGHLAGTRAPRVYKAAFTAAANRPYVVREVLPGASLDRVLFQVAGEGRPPRYSEVHSLLRAVSEAVAELHSAGVVHGDIKPANIIAEWTRTGDTLGIVADGPVKLLDFESAVIVEAGTRATLAEVARGTPFYMAPERYAQSRISPAADVYSLSAMAALLLTGRPTLPGKAAGGRIPSSRLRATVRRGLSVDMSIRFESVTDWMRDMERGFRHVFDDGHDPEVNWPRDDPGGVQREISEQAVSVAIGSLDRYADVGSRVDVATLDSIVRSRYYGVDALTRAAVDAVWFDRVSMDQAASRLGIPASDVAERLERFSAELAEFIRAQALERERHRTTR